MPERQGALVVLLSDIAGQGDHLPFRLVSQSHLSEAFDKDGFWFKDFKRLVKVDDDRRIIGVIWIFQAVPYFDALELGCMLFDRDRWGQGLMTETAGRVVDYIFSSERGNRIKIRCDVEKLGCSHEGVASQATSRRPASWRKMQA